MTEPSGGLPQQVPVFAAIKPKGSPHSAAIIDIITSAGFAVANKRRTVLDARHAQIIYPRLYRELLGAEGGAVYWRNHVRYLGSAPSLLLYLTSGNPQAHEQLCSLKGESAYSDQCSPGTIRHTFPGLGIFNSFHCASDVEESVAAIGAFDMWK